VKFNDKKTVCEAYTNGVLSYEIFEKINEV